MSHEETRKIGQKQPKKPYFYPSKSQKGLSDILNATVNRYYNLVLNKNDSKLGVFICHTKSSPNGKEELTNLQEKLTSAIKEIDIFVDRTDIGMGEDLEPTIYKNATTRAMILLLTDDISSREWCKREVFYAKKYLMPIIIIDAIEKKDDRLFAYFGNVPIIKYSGKNIGEIYEFLAFEVLTCLYNRFKFDFKEGTKVLSGKIELLDIVATDFSKGKQIKDTNIIYHDPPIYWIENDIIKNAAQHYGIKVHTPITRLMEKYSVNSCKALISSSKDGIAYIDGDCCKSGIDYAVKEITRYLIFNGYTIVNGGHFKKGGFNELILEQIRQYQKRISDKKVYGICYVNAYNYSKEKEFIEEHFKKEFEYISSRKGRKYTDYIRIVTPPDNEILLTKEEQLRLNRIRITNDCDMHIVIGGTVAEEKTGIDQEVEMSIQNKTPIYLVGGFGYKAKQLCQKYVNTENYNLLNNGLSYSENVELSETKEIDEILVLILKGIKFIKSKS